MANTQGKPGVVKRAWYTVQTFWVVFVIFSVVLTFGRLTANYQDGEGSLGAVKAVVKEAGVPFSAAYDFYQAHWGDRETSSADNSSDSQKEEEEAMDEATDEADKAEDSEVDAPKAEKPRLKPRIQIH